MNEDTVIVPLRVSREQRRLWRVAAGGEDKSVQAWILERLSNGGGRTIAEGGKVSVGSAPMTRVEVAKRPVKAPVVRCAKCIYAIKPEGGYRCVKCGFEP